MAQGAGLSGERAPPTKDAARGCYQWAAGHCTRDAAHPACPPLTVRCARVGSGAQGAGGLDDDGFDQQMAKRGRSPSVGRGGGGGGRGGGGGPNAKRQSKNEQYGFGGRKKVQKQNDAASAADMSGYKGNKGGGGGGGRGGRGGGRGGRGGGRGGASNRPGKERRKQMK